MNSYLVTSPKTTEPSEQAESALEPIATDLSDVLAGYETMLEKADPELVPMITSLHDLHKKHLVVLLNLLTERGESPEDIGSSMGSVHKFVATARDWIGSLDASSRQSILDGEKRVLESYGDALEQSQDDTEIHDLLVQQRDALKSLVERLDA